MDVKTKLGTLRAQAYFDKEYPGINISICRGNKRIGLCLVEVDQYEEKPVLKIHVWSPDVKIDEPIFDLNEADMDKMFEEV